MCVLHPRRNVCFPSKGRCVIIQGGAFPPQKEDVFPHMVCFLQKRMPFPHSQKDACIGSVFLPKEDLFPHSKRPFPGKKLNFCQKKDDVYPQRNKGFLKGRCDHPQEEFLHRKVHFPPNEEAFCHGNIIPQKKAVFYEGRCVPSQEHAFPSQEEDFLRRRCLPHQSKCSSTVRKVYFPQRKMCSHIERCNSQQKVNFLHRKVCLPRLDEGFIPQEGAFTPKECVFQP
ncbi:PREDICTED: uncharacterized protein LOC102261727 [Myotis brandtii]|uniref:uncharacterized protein LOC102261727 n=1 Tax=Myotis brandtii TaxID=109478 RepID=UPI0007041DF4|nr:PREDICTED: uncharacterized protein LOC102261727 [Myotis brandtii]